MIFRQRTRKRKRKVKGAREKLSDTPLHVDIQSLPLERALLKLRVVSELKLRFLEAVLHPTLDVDARVARQPRLRARVHGAEGAEARRVERVLDGEDVHVVVAHVVAPRVQHAQRHRELPLQRLVHRAQAAVRRRRTELLALLAVLHLAALRSRQPLRLLLRLLPEAAAAACGAHHRQAAHERDDAQPHGQQPRVHAAVVVVRLGFPHVRVRPLVLPLVREAAAAGAAAAAVRQHARRHRRRHRLRRRKVGQEARHVPLAPLDGALRQPPPRARPRVRQPARDGVLAAGHHDRRVGDEREARHPVAASARDARDAEHRRRHPLAQPYVLAAPRQHAARVHLHLERLAAAEARAAEGERVEAPRAADGACHAQRLKAQLAGARLVADAAARRVGVRREAERRPRVDAGRRRRLERRRGAGERVGEGGGVEGRAVGPRPRRGGVRAAGADPDVAVRARAQVRGERVLAGRGAVEAEQVSAAAAAAALRAVPGLEHQGRRGGVDAEGAVGLERGAKLLRGVRGRQRGEQRGCGGEHKEERRRWRPARRRVTGRGRSGRVGSGRGGGRRTHRCGGRGGGAEKWTRECVREPFFPLSPPPIKKRNQWVCNFFPLFSPLAFRSCICCCCGVAFLCCCCCFFLGGGSAMKYRYC
eukprot:Rhum_TRINITY_DN14670_c5_g1::Rhum_TRINITY_DN14670_c5_g1_i5::g.108300::m.108300